MSCKEKLDNLMQKMADILANCESPIIASSFGKDSNLVLYIARQIRQNIPVLCFNWWWTPHQLIFVKQLIKEWELKCFFYRPNRLDNIGESIISYYQIGDKEMPVIADVENGHEKCGIEAGQKALKNPHIPSFWWDCLITGSKKADKHSLVPCDKSVTEYSNNGVKIETPLWDWTDREVFEAIELLKIPIDNRVYQEQDLTADTGSFNYCVNCVRAKQTEQVFCPKVNKEIFGLQP